MARGGKKPSATQPSKTDRKHASSTCPKEDIGPAPEGPITTDLQQKCLDIFRTACKTSSSDSAIIQEVKGHLFDRNFDQAFGQEEYLRVYASRWSPSRALGYLQILNNLTNYLQPGGNAERGREDESPLRVVCLGGGAGGELMALAGWHSAIASAESLPNVSTSLRIDLVDLADWSNITTELQRAITTSPELSTYASQAARDASGPLLRPEEISVDFHHLDVLEAGQDVMVELFAKADLITCMFTLNELYTTSIPKTQQLLSTLTNSARAGSCLLIVDSPGSYATVSLNGSEKRYPMQWLLDYTLRGVKPKEEDGKWQRLESVDSQWFRMPQGLQYPIELENMRYQIHLYRRMADTGG